MFATGTNTSFLTINFTRPSTWSATEVEAGVQLNTAYRTDVTYPEGSGPEGATNRFAPNSALFAINASVAWNYTMFGNTSTSPGIEKPQPQITMTKCRVDWCEQVYHESRAKGGALQHKLNSVKILRDEAGHEAMNLGSNGTKHRFDVNRTTSYSTESMLELLTGMKSTWMDQYANQHSATRQGEVYKALPDVHQYRNFEAVFNDTVAGFDAMIRSKSMDNSRATIVDGDVLVRETYIEVRWPWLILPFSETVLALLLLFLTIGLSQSSPRWKSSAIAPLYHRLEG